MHVTIIGSAAGGGFPQWNCGDRLNRAGWTGELAARTQSSIAVSADREKWVLIDVSPDIRQQIAATPRLWPSAGERSTPIRAAVLTSADIDHVAGLLSLRERQPFALYASRPVLAALAENAIFNVLDQTIVPRRLLAMDEELEIRDAEGVGTGVFVEAFATPGKIALFLEDESRPDSAFASDDGDTIGVRIVEPSTGDCIFYIPGCARIEPDLSRRVAGCACLVFDGTLYVDDEMIAAGVGLKTGGRMGHVAMSGPDGAISLLANVPVGRRIFTHVNNTNPALDERSRAYAELRAAGWEIARDGQEIEL